MDHQLIFNDIKKMDHQLTFNEKMDNKLIFNDMKNEPSIDIKNHKLIINDIKKMTINGSIQKNKPSTDIQ